MRICLNLPVNSVSFGQVSTLLLRNFLLDSKVDPDLFVIGNQIDLSAQESINPNFIKWIENKISISLSRHDRNNPNFKLWHLNGSLESLSKEQNLFTFYELDAPTKEEVNIVANQKNVIFSSEFSVENFRSKGCKNVHYVPLAFDHYNFKQTSKKYFQDGRIVFNLCGKLEKRKRHQKIIKSWIKKFGNNKKYFLQCAIFNPFLKIEDQQNLILNILEGNKYFNISFLGMMEKNTAYNDFLNSANIIIGMSGGEGWGLPEFHSVALGKHGIIMNAHGYKGWANENNSILVNPSKDKIEAYDNMFFKKDIPFNQGHIYDFDEEEFIHGCEKAIEKVEKDPINTEGLKLQESFSDKKMYDNIINIINK